MMAAVLRTRCVSVCGTGPLIAIGALVAPIYTDPSLTAPVSAVKAAHVQELRDAILALLVF